MFVARLSSRRCRSEINLALQTILYFILIVTTILALTSCSATEEVTPPPKKDTVVVKPPEPKPEPVRNFDFADRYVISNAEIAPDLTSKENIKDFITGDFVQFRKGNRHILLIDKFEDDNSAPGSKVETVLAIQFDKMQVGTTNVKDPSCKIVFYRTFFNADRSNRSRIDGKQADGFLQIESYTENDVTGKFDLNVEGVQKAFDKPETPVRVKFAGSFQLRYIPVTSVPNVNK
jgi:hypothetical protein